MESRTDANGRLLTSLLAGSTVPYVVERILAQGAEANKDRVFIPTGTPLLS